MFLTALTVVLGPVVEGRMKGVMNLVKRFQRLSDHVVVCGYSGVAASIIAELRERRVSVFIVDDREKVVQQLLAKGLDVLEGDPTLRETLVEANAVTARAVIAACDSDGMNTLVAVNAKDLRDTTPRVQFAILEALSEECVADLDQLVIEATFAELQAAMEAGDLTAAELTTARLAKVPDALRTGRTPWADRT